jgi:hypothetical protein
VSVAAPTVCRVDDLAFYRRHSPLTDPGAFRHLFDGLPAGLGDLQAIVREVVLHRDETRAVFGFDLPQERRADAGTRYVEAILGRLRDLRPRPPAERFAGTCRDFSVLLCAMLRAAGTPARLRSGFAGYFTSGFFDEHWVVEYRAGDAWRLADAQVAGDGRVPGVDFDITDVPRDRFLVAGQAWLDCRAGRRDPDTFGVGIAGITGMWEVQGPVVRDLAALTSVETLPWDAWGVIDRRYDTLGPDDVMLLDRAAEVGVAGGPPAAAIALRDADPRLRVPDGPLTGAGLVGERA